MLRSVHNMMGCGSRNRVFFAMGLCLVAAASASAYDLPMVILSAENNILPDVVLVVVFWAYTPLVWIVEGAVLERFFPIGLYRCFGYAALANSLSTFMSILWRIAIVGALGPVMSDQTVRWMDTWIDGNRILTVSMFLRLFIVVTLLEASVTWLLIRQELRERLNTWWVLRAVALANALSYSLTIALIIFLDKVL